jgi:hypothetical protein
VNKILLVSLIVVSLLACTAAGGFSGFLGQNVSVTSMHDVHLIAGSDCQSNPCCPSTVIKASDKFECASFNINLYPSKFNDPQPATYFTDLLEIVNVGQVSHKIQGITVSVISGSSNLGTLKIYYLENQTDDLKNAISIATCTLGNDTSGAISLINSSHEIASGSLEYIEIAAYAAPNAEPNANVTFMLCLRW